MEPTEAINLVEVVLRDLVREVIGDVWQSESYIDIAKLESKRDEERAKKRGVAVSDDLLAFTEFLQLQKIIERNWTKFEPALKKKKYFDVYMDRLAGFRNPTMHSRTLLPFEAALVEGIAGEFRNLVPIYRSTRGPDMKYYPEIDQIVDSFGNQITHGMKTGLVLRPGDQISFKCVGTDPHGRELSWVLYTTAPQGYYRETDRSEGKEAVLAWSVSDEDVRERAVVSIRLVGSGPYHRHGSWDQEMIAYYGVDPPL